MAYSSSDIYGMFQAPTYEEMLYGGMKEPPAAWNQLAQAEKMYGLMGLIKENRPDMFNKEGYPLFDVSKLFSSEKGSAGNKDVISLIVKLLGL
jgi:hypothetical protein